MADRSMIAKVMHIVLFALLLCFWVIWLAGIGASQDVCVDERGGRRQLLGKEVQDCGMELSLPWWVLFLELFAIIGAMALSLVPFMARFEQTVIALFLMATTLMCVTANGFVIDAYSNYRRDLDGRGPDATACAAAGNVGLLLLNFIYIILVTDRDGAFKPNLQMPTPSYDMRAATPPPKQIEAAVPSPATTQDMKV